MGFQGYVWAAKQYYDLLYGDYLTSGWNQKKYDEYMRNRAWLPKYKEFADTKIGQMKNEWYFQQYGMTWDDVTQPWNLPGYDMQQNAANSIASTATRALNFVSRNIDKLYGDDEKPKIRRDEVDDYMKFQMWRHGF